MLKVSNKSIRLEYSHSDRKIMLFDLVIDGHHAGYIYHLIRFWGEQELPGTLDIVVAPKFIQQHKDVVDLAAKYSNRVNLVPITAKEEAALLPQSNSAPAVPPPFVAGPLPPIITEASPSPSAAPIIPVLPIPTSQGPALSG